MMGEKRYRPPVGPGSELQPQEKKEYVPPVGPGSKSVKPSGDWRDLPSGLIPKIQEIEE
jgi:hypothetical protein